MKGVFINIVVIVGQDYRQKYATDEDTDNYDERKIDIFEFADHVKVFKRRLDDHLQADEAKNLFENRKKLINKAFSEFDAKDNDKVFNFDEVLKNSEKDVGKNWKSITEKDPEANKTFPIIDSANIEKLRSVIKEDLSLYMKDNYPSLKKDL